MPQEQKSSSSHEMPHVCPTGCGGTRFSRGEIFEKRSLFTCSRCTVQFWWPLSYPSREHYELFWHPDFSVSRSFFFLSWGQRQFFKTMPARRGKKLLDVGCGPGDFLNEARRRGFSVVGFDPAVSAQETAKHTYGIDTVHSADFSYFEKRGEVFDVITAFQVLEHLPDPLSFLQNVKRIQASRGLLALAVPNSARRSSNRKEEWDYPPNHLFRWNREALRTFLERNGYEVCVLNEQPYGAHVFYERGLLSFGIIKRFKSRASCASTYLGEVRPIVPRLIMKIALYKNALLLFLLGVLLFPFFFLVRKLGWKYSELYCLAQRT